MKNSSKNNYSGNNRKHNKNKFDTNFYLKNKTSSKKNNRFLSGSDKNQGIIKSNESDKKKANFTYSKRVKPINKVSLKSSSKFQDIYHEPANKKNFDDWIWGKHSVFEALISERSINRI